MEAVSEIFNPWFSNLVNDIITLTAIVAAVGIPGALAISRIRSWFRALVS